MPRYIDVDDLKKRIDHFPSIRDTVRKELRYVRSADVVEVKHGKWIVNISDYKSVCSVCGEDETNFIHGTEMWYGLGKSKFCPNCGADMRERREDE